MPFAPASPMTGGPQTGLTSPTYTLIGDTPPNAHSVQFAVSALGGTQVGVTTHSVSSPFTQTVERPASFKSLGSVNPSTGYISNVPVNKFKVRTRKGVTPALDQPIKVATAETIITVPAGVDVYDAVNLRALLSLHFGTCWAESAELGDITVNGVV